MESKNKEQPPSSDNCDPLAKKTKEAEEIKNAHAVGLGAMGRSDEALPDKPEKQTKIEPGDY
jgi:hypothetical protein